MQGLIGLVILVFDIIAILDIVKSKMDSGKKILCALLVIFLPLVGMVLYYVVGKKQLS